MNSNLENTFLRLGYALRELKNHKNSTLILGAGCSLNSSTKDISTVGIMKSCLFEHGVDEANDYEWETLYKTFVNVVWQGKGKIEQKLLLESKLNDVEPSSGHKYLRSLVENGYIHNIITTNFDLLLEKTFEGLSYRKRVGTNNYKTVGEEPIVDILKVHGDLEEGEFRFAPSELMKLPDSLRGEISQKTSGLLIFIGYRGQDIGLMNSISTSNSFATYWIDVNEPNMGDTYTTKHIFDFMSQRGSLNNFLHGSEFGNFHSVMKKLNKLLVNPPHTMVIKSKEIVLNDEWKYSSIVEMIMIYDRIYELFLDILAASDRISQKHAQRLITFVYGETYNELLHTFLYFFNSKKLPSDLLHIPNNEVDALLLGTSIEVLVRTSNHCISVEEFVTELKLEIHKRHTSALIDDTFWDAINKMTCSESKTNKNIKINFNERLSLDSTNTPIDALYEMLKAIRFLSLLLPTPQVHKDQSNESYKIRKLLIEKSVNIDFTNTNIILDLGIIDEEISDSFVSFCLLYLPDAHRECKMISSSRKCMSISSKWIYITFETSVINDNSNNALSLYSKIKEISVKTTSTFMNLTSSFNMKQSEYVELSIDNDLVDFINSQKSAIFIVGASGSGKTTALQNYIKTFENVIIIGSPKYTTINKPNLSIFLDFDLADISDDVLLSQINTIFKERNEKLVLIFDGLNEINCKIDEQSIYYVFLLELAEKIFYNNCHNIKLIVTCRERAYYQYRNITSLQLNYMFFYNNENSQKNIENNDYSYHISSLNEKEKRELIRKYIYDLNKKQQFEYILENIATTPFMIAAAATTLKLYPHIDMRDIYSRFTNAMLDKLKEPEKYFARKIIYTYFDLMIYYRFTNLEITKFKIIDKIPLEYHDKLNDIINQLIDINILSDDLRKIRFQHDKVEEFFFKEYIEENEHKGTVFFNEVLELGYNNVIYQGGFLQYIKELISKKKLQVFKDIPVSLFERHIYTISKMVVEALTTSYDLHSIFAYILNINDSSDSTKMVNLIIWGLDDYLQDYSIIKFDLKRIIKELLIISQNNYIVSEKKANLYYLESKIYYFENNYYKSQEFANQALSTVDTSNIILLSQIRVHFSVILMELGYSKKSIESLEKEYELFVDTNDEKTFFNIALELGRALNHSAQINQSLNLYHKLEKIQSKISNPYSLARFYEQKANVINRIMYDKLQYGFVGKKTLTREVREEIEQLFLQAIQLYDKSMNILLDINALWSYTGVVPEKINTYISYSYSICPTGIQECSDLIDKVDQIFSGFTTPFKTDFYLSKAYYYEFINNVNAAETFIHKALENAEILGIKNKEAKCHEFYSQLAYRMILNKNHQHSMQQWISLGLAHVIKAINYYEEFTLTENNIALKNAINLKMQIEKLNVT